MKKILALSISLILLVLFTQCTLGSVHPPKDGFFSINEYSLLLDMGAPNNDLWYQVEKEEKPQAKGYLALSEDQTILGGNYFLNDQTFANISFNSTSNTSITDLRGSYLFNFGLFAGISYADSTSNDGYGQISPGYRYDFNENAYAAITVDYFTEEGKILGEEVYFKYYLDDMKIYGQGLFIDGGTTLLLIGVNRKFNENIVGGAKLQHLDDKTGIIAGATWSRDNFIVNGEIASEALIFGNYIALGATYKMNDRLDLGLGYFGMEERDPTISLKAAYHKDDFLKFIFTYYTVNPLPGT